MNPRILIVDDTEELVIAMMAYLADEGYQIYSAHNGVEALSKLAENSFDLIISDIMMPKMGGFEFIEKLNSISSNDDVKVILMSSKSKDSIDTLVSELKVAAFLEKPFKLSDLSEMVKTLLNQSKESQ